MTASQVKGQRSNGKGKVKGAGLGQRCRAKVRAMGRLRQGQRYQVVDWRWSAAIDQHDHSAVAGRIDEEPASESVRFTTFREHFVSLIPKRVPAEHLIGASAGRTPDRRHASERRFQRRVRAHRSLRKHQHVLGRRVDGPGSRHRVKVPPGHGSERLTMSRGASGAPLLVHDDTRIPHFQWAEHAACQERLRRTGLPSWPMRARAVPSPHSNTRTAYRDHAAVSNRRGTHADRRHDIQRTGRPGIAGRGWWGRAATPKCEWPSRRV